MAVPFCCKTRICHPFCRTLSQGGHRQSCRKVARCSALACPDHDTRQGRLAPQSSSRRQTFSHRRPSSPSPDGTADLDEQHRKSELKKALKPGIHTCQHSFASARRSRYEVLSFHPLRHLIVSDSVFAPDGDLFRQAGPRYHHWNWDAEDFKKSGRGIVIPDSSITRRAQWA